MCDACEKRFASLEENLAEVRAEWSCSQCGKCTFEMGTEPQPRKQTFMECATSVNAFIVFMLWFATIIGAISIVGIVLKL